MNLEETDYTWETRADEKYYEWQLLVGQQWLRIDNDFVIETHYCQPGAKGMTIHTIHGQVFIDFDKLQTTNSAMKVQRRSLLPQGQTEDVGWYYRDDQLWLEYGSQSTTVLSASVSSGDVERQFALNPQGSFSFTVGAIGYKLDFSTMSQLNSNSGMRRKVRRRPKFKSNTGSLYATSGLLSASSSQLSDGSFKWEFMGDEGVWTEYQAHVCSFDSAAIERQYQLDPQGQLSFRIRKFSYTLDFSTMHQVNDSMGTRRAVRRTADSQQNSSLYATSGLLSASSSQLSDGSFKWEFMGDEGVWTEYQAHVCSFDSAAIERQYQLDPQGQLSFRIRKFSYTLDFSAMHQVNDSMGTRRAVRRTADSQQNSSSGGTPRWQFQDIGGIWKDYSKNNNGCSMSSQDIELQYQLNPSGTMTFTSKRFKYELNFSAMTQMNLSTTTTRSVRRLNQ